MTATAVGFYLLSAVAVAAAVMLVASRNVWHAVLALAVVSLAVAGLMLTVSAEFLAFVLVLVYVGAVVVLAVFAILLTGNFGRSALPSSNELTVLAGLTSLALTALVAGVLLSRPAATAAAAGQFTVRQLGELLLGPFVLPFELVSVLLLAALIGAIVIARGQED
ncbi:MAG: NADH-quinone oxidoreductase subunit J [candidate division FCPU426 bacterium]